MDKPIPEAVRALRELRDTGDVSDWHAMDSALDAAIAALTAAQQQGQAVACPYCGGTGGHWEGCRAPVDIQPMQQGGGEVVAEVLRVDEGTALVSLFDDSLRVGSSLYTAPPSAPVGGDGLAGLLEQIRDLLASLPVDCLGTDTAADGQPYPIRDEVIHSITKALAQQPAAVDEAMVERAARAICTAHGWNPDEPVKYAGTNRIARERDGSPVPQWTMHVTDARAALATQHQEPTT